jgi:hypothetical protein
MIFNFRHWLQFSMIAAVLSAPGMAQVVVKTVPWIPTNASSPHTVITGVQAILGATVDVGTSSDAFTYSWNFGDSSAATVPAPLLSRPSFANVYNIPATPTYTASPGTTYTAVLTVNDITTSTSYTGNYPVIVQANTLASRVNVAIDNGLWYLHLTMWHGTSLNSVPWGGWDEALTGSGTCPTVNGNAYSCAFSVGAIDANNTQAFEISGHL